MNLISPFQKRSRDYALAWCNRGEAQEISIPAGTITQRDWNFTFGDNSETLQKLNKYPTKLGDITKIFQGLVTSADKVFVLEEVNQPIDGYIKVRDQNGQEWLLEQAILKPFINKVTVSTYNKPKGHHWIIFPYKIFNDKAILIPASEISTYYPNVWHYLITKSKTLRERESGKADNDQWYGYIYPKNLTLFDPPKLIVQVISLHGRYAYDEDKIYFTGGGNGPYYGILWLDTDNPHSLHYLQGLLSSKLLDTYLHSISSPFRGGYWSYGKRFIEQIPIRIINFSDPVDKARHDWMVEHVERMLSLHKSLEEASSQSSLILTGVR